MALDVKSFWHFGFGEDSPGICCPRHLSGIPFLFTIQQTGEKPQRKQAFKSKCQIYLETSFDTDSKIKGWTSSVIFTGSTVSPPTLFIAQSLQSTKKTQKTDLTGTWKYPCFQGLRELRA